MEPNTTFEIEAPHQNHHAHFSSKRLKSKTWDESKKMWDIVAPAILGTVAQFSIGVVTVAFAGYLGEVELAAISIVQNVLDGFVFGIFVLTIISVLVLGFHVILNWILITKLETGLAGAAIAENILWWLVVLAQLVYVVSGFFPQSWTGFSMSAFESLLSFVKLSIASAVMLCLELWYYTIVILMVGSLKNPEIAVDAISIWSVLLLIYSRFSLII